MPKWEELRTQTMPTPVAFALSIARRIAAAALSWPMAKCASISAETGVWRTISGTARTFTLPEAMFW